MKKRFKNLVSALMLAPTFTFGAEVVEPAGELPVLREVDVVVVGGASGGVAAAVEAARQGAKVFLAAPRPYLGEDICATYRLWLEPGETATTELARQVFAGSSHASELVTGNALPFTYSASLPSDSKHRDTATPSLLHDDKWHSAPGESVQYNGDVTLLLDLGREQAISKVHLMAYQRPGDFEVDQIKVSCGADQDARTQIALLKNLQPGQGHEEGAVIFSAAIPVKARYVQFAVSKTSESQRLLLGEIVVEGTNAPPQTGSPVAAIRPVTPMHVKRTLDQALIKAGVPFLFWSYATDLLRDAQGKPAGVVIENRSGRQAVLAKVVIDATERGNLARLTPAEFVAFPPGAHPFSRVVVGGPASRHASVRLRQRETPVTITDRKGDVFPVLEYQFDAPMDDGNFSSFAALEQMARDWTWTKEAVDGSEVLFQVPPDSFRGRQSHRGPWPGADKISLECFQPAGTERLLVLSGCADVSREAAVQLTRPVNLMAVGERMGKAAAELAASQPGLSGVRLEGGPVQSPAVGSVHPSHSGRSHRAGERTVPAESRGLPVLGEYDVVVVGGGTGGAPAAIASGRQGAKTLLVEYLHGLGGVGTMGYISSYYHGNRVGFTSEIDRHVAALAGPNTRTQSGSWDPEHKSEVYRGELRKAGVDLWYGCLGSGAVMENHRVRGIVVLTPHGRGVILARVVVDSTGNADIASAAGAMCRYTDDTDVAVQGTGLPPRELGQKYTNTDYTFVDDTDVFDIWRVLVVAKQKYKAAYDLGQLIDTRERRQIVGDFTLSPMDMVMRRTQPDTVVIARSNFDTHGYIIHPMFMIRPPDRDSIDVRVPYRCLLPQGLDGILVTGLGISAHRDALPCIRMQADVQNQGYAAGVAAAMTARYRSTTRALDIKDLQQHLVAVGNLPASVLAEKDSFPLPREAVVKAVAAVANDYQQLESVLAQFDVARPLLQDALAGAGSDEAKLIYAHILGMMGDAAGAGVLARAVAAREWDQGWNFKGMGQFGASMSPLDSLIIALGRTKSPTALKPILAKMSQLDASSQFSHFRAVAIALETLGDKAAAPPLAALLQIPGISGHAVTSIGAALETNPTSATDNATRNQALIELYLARALFRCGDDHGIGEKILKQFAQDLHGHYARHAQAVLERPPNKPAN